MAALAGVKAAKLNCYLDGYRYRVCRNAGELAEEVRRRESLLESMHVGKTGGHDEELFHQRIEHWKNLAEGSFLELRILRGAIDYINQRYFDGQQTLFPREAEGLDQLMDLVEKLVDIYNQDLADGLERLERLMNNTGPEERKVRLTIDLADLIGRTGASANEQVVYLVDMAKADALDLLGERSAALELVDRHV